MGVWESSDGLPNNYLTSIAQTGDSYLWIGTYTSLVRFDGTAFDARPGDTLIKPTVDEIATMAPARDGVNRQSAAAGVRPSAR